MSECYPRGRLHEIALERYLRNSWDQGRTIARKSSLEGLYVRVGGGLYVCAGEA